MESGAQRGRCDRLLLRDSEDVCDTMRSPRSRAEYLITHIAATCGSEASCLRGSGSRGGDETLDSELLLVVLMLLGEPLGSVRIPSPPTQTIRGSSPLSHHRNLRLQVIRCLLKVCAPPLWKKRGADGRLMDEAEFPENVALVPEKSNVHVHVHEAQSGEEPFPVPA
ncbi:hypothetical protein KOW79_007665 [Hemibagrus wyckioides]|uniref:Uncharacterized protein n=1 Tax=Hemibagrus wyckioides TaxID=337641 RepID=A0A9D3NVV7_9TELE|nr:hypothetical protein KOW79_007665 [Hemibagrus wyckioides]